MEQREHLQEALIKRQLRFKTLKEQHSKVKVLHLSHSDSKSGAARAAFEICIGQRAHGMNVRLFVRVKHSRVEWIIGPSSRTSSVVSAARAVWGRELISVFAGRASRTHTLSMNLLPSRFAKMVKKESPSVFNLHWVGTETISLADISHIKCPIVWTLHDMWPLLGLSHYPAVSTNGNRIRSPQEEDWRLERLDKLTRQRKERFWSQEWLLVAPTAWMATMARTSPLTKNNEVAVVPNPVNTDVFRPANQAFARQLFGLPLQARVLLFGSIDGGGDMRKGADLLLSALDLLPLRLKKDLVLFILGASIPPPCLRVLSIRTHGSGFLTDNVALSLAYSAADLVAVPSRLDNLPQLATEAASCGRPVVAFNCGGLPDAVVDRVTGRLISPFDVSEFADAIRQILDDPQILAQYATAARELALNRWQGNKIAASYASIYQKLI